MFYDFRSNPEFTMLQALMKPEWADRSFSTYGRFMRYFKVLPSTKPEFLEHCLFFEGDYYILASKMVSAPDYSYGQSLIFLRIDTNWPVILNFSDFNNHNAIEIVDANSIQVQVNFVNVD